MGHRANNNRAFKLLLLFCMVLVAQGLAIAHEFDHLASGDNSSCLICSAGSNLEAAATDSGNLLAQYAPLTSKPQHFDYFGKDAFSDTSWARAPPTFL